MADNRFAKYAPQGVQTKPADPRLPSQLIKDRNDAAASVYAPPKAAADTTIAQAEAANATAVANAQRDRAIAEAEKAQVELEKLRLEQSKVDPKSGAYKALQTQIDRVSELYRQELQGWAPNVLNRLVPDFLQPNKAAFDSSAQGLVNPFMAAFKVPGQGSQSDTELRQFLAANTPEQGDSDAVIEEKIRTIQSRLDAEIPPEKTDKSTQLVAGPGAPDQMALSKDGTRAEIDPILKGVAGRLGKMVSAGATDATIIEFLKKNGVDPAKTNVNVVLQERRKPSFKTWQRANPGEPYPIGPSFYTKKVALDDSGILGYLQLSPKEMNEHAQSGPGAFAIAAGQGFSGNRLDGLAEALGGDPEAVNTGIQLSRANSPRMSFAGDLAGQAGAQYLMGRIPGFRALPGSSAGRMADDALYGAYAGQGEGDTLGGVAANVIGGKVGRGVSKGAGVAARGVNGSTSLNYLNAADVPMTVGQIGRGTNSVMGNVVGGLEDRAAGFPLFDAIINTARRRGDEGFNSAAFREMGGSGATGAPGVVEGRGLVDNAYNFLGGANMPLDAKFAGSQAGVRAALPGLPAYGPEIGKSLDKIDMSASGGALAGRDWQSALRSTKRNRSSIRSKEFSDDAVGALDDVEGNLLSLASRQGPPGSQAALGSANRLNMDFRTLTSALDNGPSQARGELFGPQRLDTAAREAKRRFGGQVASMSGERPFYDLTKAGMDVMPNLTPDSGTAGRAIFYSALPGMLGGGIGAVAADDPGQGAAIGTGYGSTLLPTLALAALYGKGGQKGLQKALLGPRPKVVGDLDKAIQKNPFLRRLMSKQMGGLLGSSVARDVSLYPELEQPF